MSFGKQVWECAVPECGRGGCVSVVVLLQGQGGRKTREKGNTKAVRLCRSHLRWFAEQQPIKSLALEVERIGQKLEPDAWKDAKQKGSK